MYNLKRYVSFRFKTEKVRNKPKMLQFDKIWFKFYQVLVIYNLINYHNVFSGEILETVPADKSIYMKHITKLKFDGR